MCRLFFAVLILAGLQTLTSAEQIGGDKAFSFVALGDMPYAVPGDYVKFDRLIAAVNKLKPAFSLHVGDTKGSKTPCTNEMLQKTFDQLQTFEGPLIFTIGDNDWTDCHTKPAGGYDPRERLAKVREIYFPYPDRSLGKAPMAVESQARLMPEFAAYVENVRFSKNGVLFIGVHIVGSNNGFEAFDIDTAKEYFARNNANIAWLDSGFKFAKDTGAKAVVVFTQAEFDVSRLPDGSMPRQSGFTGVLNAIERGAQAFSKPVLVVNGDEHYIELKPLKNSSGKPIPNVLKLMVYGEFDVHAVRVLVDPESAGVFGFIPLIVPENGMGNCAQPKCETASTQ
jgi:hypothetical protein